MGTETYSNISYLNHLFVEKMGPLRGDGNLFSLSYFSTIALNVEKMGPLRGDGNSFIFFFHLCALVEKMGPLRGDGNPKFSRNVLMAV